MFSTCESSDDVEGAISGIRILRDLCKQNVEKITSREPVIYGLLGAELRVEDISTSRGMISIRRAYLRSSEYHVGWVLDKDISSCMICDIKFSFNKRRHHCRACGSLICNECSMSRATIVQLHRSFRFRVCDLCTARCSTLDDWNITQKKAYDDSKHIDAVAVLNGDVSESFATVEDVAIVDEVAQVESLPAIALPSPTVEAHPSPQPSPSRASVTQDDLVDVKPSPVSVPCTPTPTSPHTPPHTPPESPATPTYISTDITSPDMSPDTSAQHTPVPISPLTPNTLDTPVIRHQHSDTTPVTISLYDDTPERARSHSLDTPQPVKAHERRRSSWREYFGFKNIDANETSPQKDQDEQGNENDEASRPVMSFVSKDPVRRASLLQLMASQDTGEAVNSTQLQVDVIGWDEDEDEADGSESSKSFSESLYYDERLYKRSLDLRNSAAADIRYSEKLSAIFPAVEAAPLDSIPTDDVDDAPVVSAANNGNESVNTSSSKKKWRKKKVKR